MASKADLAVFIGRFQPLHLGHAHVLRQAYDAAKSVLVLIGSADAPRSIRNPFTYEERAAMIQHSLSTLDVNSLAYTIRPLPDILYSDDLWIEEIQRIVGSFGLADEHITLVGHSKDATSYYLKKFPNWDTVDVTGFATLSSTEIRDVYLRRLPTVPQNVMPAPVEDFLREFSRGDEFRELVAEADFVRDYRRRWESAPYPPTFVTVDAVVIQSGHVLLIRRKDHPGRGLLALPGGFLDPKESIRNAVVRELKEETRISDHRGEIPPAQLGSFIEDTETKIFDDTNRDPRGRTITHAHLFRMPERNELFRVKGSSDASDAQWYAIGSLNPSDFYADHWHILRRMIGG
jgi:bifunctional NMN adenylyltransferase/nudix hydrolase